MSPIEPSPDDRTETFLTLLSEHERLLSIYVTGLVGVPQDTQDILQEGKIVMWRHFDSFRLGTNFVAWARKILFHQVLEYRRRTKRDSHLLLSEETLGLLDHEADSAIRENRWIHREAALHQCIEALKADHRQILDMRYRDEASIEKIAHQSGKTESAVYRLLSRLRKSLFECVESNLAGTTTES